MQHTHGVGIYGTEPSGELGNLWLAGISHMLICNI